MIVCSCHAITDRDLRTAVRDGAGSLAEAQMATRAGMGCGGCRMAIAAVVQDEMHAADVSPLRIYRSDFEAQLAAG